MLNIIRRILARALKAQQIPDGVVIGNNVWIGDYSRFDWSHGRHITIEDDVSISTGVRILCHDASSKRSTGATWVAPVRIAKGAFIGTEAVILPGVTIGAGAIVAAGAVVVHDVEPGAIVAGTPARQIGLASDLHDKRRQMLDQYPKVDRARFADDHLSLQDNAYLRQLADQHGGYFRV